MGKEKLAGFVDRVQEALVGGVGLFVAGARRTETQADERKIGRGQALEARGSIDPPGKEVGEADVLAQGVRNAFGAANSTTIRAFQIQILQDDAIITEDRCTSARNKAPNLNVQKYSDYGAEDPAARTVIAR